MSDSVNRSYLVQNRGFRLWIYSDFENVIFHIMTAHWSYYDLRLHTIYDHCVRIFENITTWHTTGHSELLGEIRFYVVNCLICGSCFFMFTVMHTHRSSVNFGGKIFLPQRYMHEKLTKFPNFTWYMLEKKLTECQNFTWFLPQKILFHEFGGGGAVPPLPPVSYAYAVMFNAAVCLHFVMCVNNSQETSPFWVQDVQQ